MGNSTVKPKGPFVLMTLEGDDILTDERGIVMMNGKPKWIGVARLYFERDLGESKAKYWTREIAYAHTFKTIDEATIQLCKLKNPELIKVRQLLAEAQEKAQ
ncbi:hypothetical protein [Serratia entomophila]|uniref:hypothetical protein n=1 Tax=Serratia entomophila TaxID=42906 RepID=UPI0021BB4681|nr:hypothetical protein [Serratia entomophila]